MKQEQYNEIQKKNLEAAMRLAQLSIENSQRIMELQVNTAKALFEEGVSKARALSETADPQQAMSLRTQFAQHTTERMLGCARQIAEISNNTQSEVGRMISQRLTASGQEYFETLQRMFQGMPITDQTTMNAMQNAMDTARSAFDQMSKASSEAFHTISRFANMQ